MLSANRVYALDGAFGYVKLIYFMRVVRVYDGCIINK